MSAFHEFHEPIGVDTPLGPGRAILIERTQHDYFWTVALDTCALVTFTQDKIRIFESYTHGRGISDEEMRGHVKTQTFKVKHELRNSVESTKEAIARAQRQATLDVMGDCDWRGGA